MVELGRATKRQAFKDALALLGLVYIGQRDQLNFTGGAGDEPLSVALKLAEAIEQHSRLARKPLSQHLVSGLSSIDSNVLSKWIQISSKSLPMAGFAEWFE